LVDSGGRDLPENLNLEGLLELGLMNLGVYVASAGLTGDLLAACLTGTGRNLVPPT